jgi:hypothetical protein
MPVRFAGVPVAHLDRGTQRARDGEVPAKTCSAHFVGGIASFVNHVGARQAQPLVLVLIHLSVEEFWG